MRSSSKPKRSPSPARAATTPKSTKGKKLVVADSSEFNKSLRIYVGCVGTLGLALIVLICLRPASPKQCDGVMPSFLLPAPIGSLSTESIQALWKCTKAYQELNWWFVLASFETLYLGLKMLAIPAAFSLGILAGALFPMPLCQVVTGFGEAIGSTLCYLLSQAFLAPIVENLFAEKLEMLRVKARQEKQFMFSFNLFLRLTPFAPNYLINLACPLVGVPLMPFFFGSLFGTQLSLLFLAVGGATLRETGETGFDLDKLKGQGKQLAALMVMLQCVPVAFVYLQKRRAATKSK